MYNRIERDKEEMAQDMLDSFSSGGYVQTETDTSNTHPLINKSSPHYQLIGGDEAIEVMEKIFTTEELMAWAKITVMKYRLRVGNKRQIEATSDLKKIETYENYYKYLDGVVK